MKTKQIYNLLKISLICTLFLFAFEVLFSFESVNNWIGNLIEQTSSQVISLVIIWIIMFLQVWLIPIPAYIVLLAASHTQLISSGFLNFGINDFVFFLVVLSAYICGFLTAYLLGYKWGKKAVQWAAGSAEDYDKWRKFLTTKGKWWYALTVLLPVFPDDILCIVAGSVKLDFKFFTIVNVIFRSIGLVCMIEALKLMGSWNSGNFPTTAVIWGIILVAIIIALIVYKIKLKKQETTNTDNKKNINTSINDDNSKDCDLNKYENSENEKNIAKDDTINNIYNKSNENKK